MTTIKSEARTPDPEVLAFIRQGKMSRFQLVTVILALALVVLDGFEVGVMAFAAPQIQEQLGLTPEILGYVLSASLLGMAVGSITLAPLADRFGRRPVTLVMLAVIVIGMVLTMVAQTAATLIIFRILTGLGIGGMMANLNALVAEYSSDARRSTAIGVFSAGYPIGATLAGLVAGPLIPQYGWHSVFFVGTVLAFVGLVISWIRLPESLDFLLERRPQGALQRVNVLLTRMNAEPLEELPPNARESEPGKAEHGAIREVLTPPTLRLSIAIWVGYAALMAAYYFANTWLPTILTNVSGDEQIGTMMGIVANVGGVLGCLLFALLAIRFSGRRLLYVALFGAAAAFILFGLVFNFLPVAFVTGFLLGVVVTVAVAGFYAVSPTLYSARARSTGVGWMFGIGRLVSVAAPILVGYILAAGLAPERVFMIFAIPLAIGAVAAVSLTLGRRTAVMAD